MLSNDMNKIVGIDLGTTNSLVATVDSGIPLVIADSEGRRLTPIGDSFPSSKTPSLSVGVAANRVRVLKPSQTVYSIKRFHGAGAARIFPKKKCSSLIPVSRKPIPAR